MIRQIGRKGRYTRGTMKTWKKDDLIDYIEILEDNEQVLYATLEQQAKNIENMLDKLKNYKEPI